MKCIGGIADGRRVAIEGTRYRVPLYRALAPYPQSEEEANRPVDVDTCVVTYTVRRIHFADGDDVLFLAPDGVSDRDAVAAALT